jgi:hypothetical protein
MSSPVGNCPQCGAKIEFRWTGALQTTCEFCQSILIRGDIDLQKVGEVADIPVDASPIQINTEGIWNNKPFTVVGRIIYEHDLGVWNEWHLLFSDNTSGWLSDAQLEWAITFQHNQTMSASEQYRVSVGQRFNWNGVDYEVTSRTMAKYRGVEGQLPFVYWNKDQVQFIDLRTQGMEFATLDFSEDPGLIFLGRFVDFEQLQLKNLKQFEGWF